LKPEILYKNKEYFNGIIAKIAFSIYQRIKILDYHSLVSAGNYGLFLAIKRYDPNKNVKFSTYCIYRIRGQMYDDIRKEKRIKKNTINDYNFDYLNNYLLTDTTFMVWDAIKSSRLISEKEYKILRLRYIYGYTNEEISIKYNVSYSRISQIINDARRKLHIRLN
jgi:RNA polymerase sigma factor (sigma-70 family)